MTDILHYCELSDEVKFNIKQPIEVQDIVKSLQALEKIVKQSTKTFSKLGGAEIEDVRLYIQTIEKGSLVEKFIVKLIFKNEENLDKFLENTHDWVKGQCKEHPVRSSFVGLVIGGMLAYAFYSLGANSANSITINGHYNTIITNGAQQLNISEQAFKTALEKNKGHKKALAKNAIEFIQPAKTEQGDVSIQFGSTNNDNIAHSVIPAEVISILPKKVKSSPQEEKSTQMDNVTLHIRSLDRDDYNEGWQGYIDDLFTKRIKIEIPKTIDLAILAKQESVKADITLYSTQKGEKTEFKRIEIRTVHTK